MVQESLTKELLRKVWVRLRKPLREFGAPRDQPQWETGSLPRAGGAGEPGEAGSPGGAPFVARLQPQLETQPRGGSKWEWIPCPLSPRWGGPGLTLRLGRVTPKSEALLRFGGFACLTQAPALPLAKANKAIHKGFGGGGYAFPEAQPPWAHDRAQKGRGWLLGARESHREWPLFSQVMDNF